MSGTEGDDSENVAVAMGLVIAAGLSTGLGAAVVFFPSIVKLASRRVLAGSLGFSAGVMTYVSFIEIFAKAQLSFEDAEIEEGKAYSYATICFFGGVVAMMIVNTIVSYLLGGHSHRHDLPDAIPQSQAHPTTEAGKANNNENTRENVENADVACPCCADDPVGQLDTMQKMADVLQREEDADVNVDVNVNVNVDRVEVPHAAEANELAPEPNTTTSDSQSVPEKESDENKRLVKMGMTTAIAIGLHNFPEGLATFVAALSDPKVGVVLAVAIAIHNIPEGLCVALPIYYATGNRMKAFLWALVSGASEIIAALLGWAVLASTFSDTTYAILFGIVAGMMVVISIRELLPTAHFYDPDDTVVTNSFIVGMIVIALSLVLFQI